MKLFKKKRESQELSTASLPDIVFMLLFFFMVPMVMRQEEPRLEVRTPEAKNIEEIKNQELCATLWVGYRPGESIPSISFDNQWIQVSEVGRLISEKKASLSEGVQSKFITIIKADREMPMEVIALVKQELRQVNALKIQYSALPSPPLVSRAEF